MQDGKGGDFIKQEWLHKKLQTDSHYSCLRSEIEQAQDFGRTISVSPSYTFYYSRETGLKYIRNAQIIRVYGELEIGRPSITYIIIENDERELIKIKGNVNYLQMRIAYDRFCPRILIGEKGREMGLEQLRIQFCVRKKALAIITATVLCWSFLCFICRYLEDWLGLTVFVLSTLVVLVTAIRMLRLMHKA